MPPILATFFVLPEGMSARAVGICVLRSTYANFVRRGKLGEIRLIGGYKTVVSKFKITSI